MKNRTKILAILLVIVGLVTIESCKEDAPTPLTVLSATAGDADLNGATSPTNVAANATLTVTFTTNVDATTATSSNITLERDYDKASIPTTITVSGATVTIDPVADLNAGSLFTLKLSSNLKSDKGVALTEVIRTFTTAGLFAPSDQIAYWPFESNTNDALGSFNASATLTKDVTYVDGRNVAAGKAASFNGTTTIIEIPNGDQFMANKDFGLSFWVKANSSKEGHFVMGLGAWKGFQFEIMGGAWTALDKGVKLATQYDLGGTVSDAEDTWWNGQPNTWQGSLYARDVSASGGIASYFQDKWAHVVCTYKSSTKVGTMYVNGQKVRAFDFNLWPAGDAKKGALGVKFAGDPAGNNLAFGFIQGSQHLTISDSWANPADPANNHFKGLLDDVRIFKRAITDGEVTLIYNSEKP